MKVTLANTGEEISIVEKVSESLDVLYRLNHELVLGIHYGRLAVLYLFIRCPSSEYKYFGDLRIRKNSFCTGAYTVGLCVAQSKVSEQSPEFIAEAIRLAELHCPHSKMVTKLAKR